MAVPASPQPPADIALWNQVAAQLSPYYLRASRKHAFDFQVTTNAVIIPFTSGRIAALIIPAGSIWIGGDGGLTVGNGLPIAAGGFLNFGPEEGDSETWVITTVAATPVDIRCIELLP